MTHFSVRIALRDLKAVILLGLVALCLHVNSLGLGFWYDDNNHLELCRKNGYAGLAAGNTFDWDQRIAHVLWARKETGWAYFRPLAVAIRTLELNIFGLNPVPFHIVYLIGYLASVLLFYGVTRRWGGSEGMAFTAGLLFTMHPAHALAAAWLACDGPVLVGIWTFLALWLLRASMDAKHRRPGLWVGIFLCYALAMMSRESGVMLGPMLVVCEWFATWRRSRPEGETQSGTWLRSCILCVAMAAEAVEFLLLRNHYVRGQLAPRSPYF